MVRIPLDGHVNLPLHIGSTRNWLNTARSARARAGALSGNLTVPPRPADHPSLQEVSAMSQKRLKCCGDDGFVAAGTAPPHGPSCSLFGSPLGLSPSLMKGFFSMEIPEDAILEMLDGRGDAKAQQARAELPDNVDTDRDQRLQAKFGP